MRLKDTGPELRARPLQYRSSTQLDLDSFVTLTNSISIQVRMKHTLYTCACAMCMIIRLSLSVYHILNNLNYPNFNYWNTLVVLTITSVVLTITSAMHKYIHVHSQITLIIQTLNYPRVSKQGCLGRPWTPHY